jgi:hypothetical protein
MLDDWLVFSKGCGVFWVMSCYLQVGFGFEVFLFLNFKALKCLLTRCLIKCSSESL